MVLLDKQLRTLENAYSKLHANDVNVFSAKNSQPYLNQSKGGKTSQFG
jgi:hypothetical protein